MRLLRLIRTTTLAAGALVGAVAAAQAERAASIDFDFVERHPQLPAAFAAGPEASLRFLKISTLDRFSVDAALWEPREADPSRRTLIISVHGSGDNFAKPPVSFLGPALAAKKLAVLAINTRQHDQLVNTDNFMHVRHDIEAAAHTARALGYRNLVVHGHSLGNIQAQFYVATAWAPDIKAMVLTGMFGNLPWKSRHMLIQNEANFGALMEAAHQALKEGAVQATMPVKMRWFTGQEVPMTAQHFLTYRSEASSAADGSYWIKRVPAPVLMVRDASDGVVAAFEPYMLLSAARAPGSLVPQIDYKLLPNDKPVNLENHYFVNNQQPLIDAIADFVNGLH